LLVREMSATVPVGYTYEADHHCPACAEARFGPAVDGIDSEGNLVGAVFSLHVADIAYETRQIEGEAWHGIACGTCGEVFTR
jgi:hypothetical protein